MYLWSIIFENCASIVPTKMMSSTNLMLHESFCSAPPSSAPHFFFLQSSAIDFITCARCARYSFFNNSTFDVFNPFFHTHGAGPHDAPLPWAGIALNSAKIPTKSKCLVGITIDAERFPRSPPACNTSFFPTTTLQDPSRPPTQVVEYGHPTAHTSCSPSARQQRRQRCWWRLYQLHSANLWFISHEKENVHSLKTSNICMRTLLCVCGQKKKARHRHGTNDNDCEVG